jgi:hypothetical protein
MTIHLRHALDHAPKSSSPLRLKGVVQLRPCGKELCSDNSITYEHNYVRAFVAPGLTLVSTRSKATVLASIYLCLRQHAFSGYFALLPTTHHLVPPSTHTFLPGPCSGLANMNSGGVLHVCFARHIESFCQTYLPTLPSTHGRNVADVSPCQAP